jgi:hypothetical protein
MLILKNIHAQSFSLRFVQLSWEIEPSPEDIFSFKFEVYRSESEEGDYNLISHRLLQDEYEYQDNQVHLLAKNKDLFYKIKVINTLDNTYEYFGPVQYAPEQDLIAIEISKRNQLVIDQFTGRQVLIYRIRTFGTRCSCYDKMLGKIIKSNCEQCFGTSWVKGYFKPIVTKMNITVPSRELIETLSGDQDPISAEGFLSNYPLLKPRDVIIENENKRYRVHRIVLNQKLRAITSQRVLLTQLTSSDIEYKLSVKLSDYVNYPMEERNITNPQNVEAI